MPLLATLAATRQPHPVGTLSAWSGLSHAAVRRLVTRPLNAFLATRGGGDPRCYSLRHQSLRDLISGTLPADVSETDRLQDLAHHLKIATDQAHERITDALTATSFAGWLQPHDYRDMTLPRHATACRRLAGLMSDPGFLVSSDAGAVRREFGALATADPVAGRNAQVFDMAGAEDVYGAWHDDEAQGRLWRLHVEARRLRCTPLAEACGAHVTAQTRLLWTTWCGTPHRRLTGHMDAVTAVVAVGLPDGRTLIATTSYDRTVRLWDPVTGTPVGDPLTDHTSGVTAVAAVGLPDGRTLLATTSDDGTVFGWEILAASVARSVQI